MPIDIDIAIVTIFLAMNLIVGLNYGRKVTSIQEYALGGRNFSTGAIVATIVATYVSGSSFMIGLTRTYNTGIDYVIASSFTSVQLVIMSFFLIPRMKQYLGSASVAELMGNLYGQNVRLITAICGTIGALGFISVQFKACGYVFSYFFSLPSSFAIIAAGSIVTIYSAFGGIRAVTFTDILQFLVFGTVLPMIGILVWHKLNVNGNFDLIAAFHNPKFNAFELLNFKNPKFWQLLPLLLFYAMPGLEPTYIQRIMIGRTIAQVKKAFLIAAGAILFIKLCVVWIPFLIYNVNPNLTSDFLLSYLVDNYTFIGIKGFIISAVIAMSMSTADSHINSSSVLFAHDICSQFKISKIRELILSKISAFVFGLFGIIMALSSKDLLDIVLLASSFYMPIVTTPLIMSILGFRTTSKSVLIGMGAGLIFVISWKLAGIEMDCIVIAMFVNLIFLLGSHYLLKQPGGFIKVEMEEPNVPVKTWSQYFQDMGQGFLNSNFVEFCRRTAPKDEIMYTALGVYIFFFTITSMYTTQQASFELNSQVMLMIYQLMMSIGILFALYPIWPPRIKYEIIVQVAWNFVIFIVLVFCSAFLVMVSDLNQLQFISFTLNIVITASLVGWKLAIAMLASGFYLSIEFYKFYAMIDTLETSFSSPQFLMMYSLLLFSSIIIIFLKPKEEEKELAEEKADHLEERIKYHQKELERALELKNEFVRNVTHEYHAPMTGALSTSQTLWESYEKLNDKMRWSAAETIYKSIVRLDSYDMNIKELSRLSIENPDFKVDKVNVTNLINKCLYNCIKIYVEDKERENRKFTLDIPENVIIDGDEYYLKQLLDNLIINAISYCKKGQIKLKLIKESDRIEFCISDQGIGIPQEELYDIFGSFTVSSKTRTPAGGRGVGLALCKKVVEMHHGQIWAECDEGVETRFMFKIPIIFTKQA